MKKKLTNKGELTTELLALVNDGDVKDIINLNAASLEKHMEELCTACMLAADTEASQILLDGIAEKSDSFQPRSRQLIANAYEYFDIMRQKGGWRPITMQCDDADTNVEHFPHGVYPEPIEVYLRRTAEVNQTAPEMPLCIALATNDGLSGSFESVAKMMTRKNVYFVPLSQDDCKNKPYSLVCDFQLVHKTIEDCMEGRQPQPIFF